MRVKTDKTKNELSITLRKEIEKICVCETNEMCIKEENGLGDMIEYCLKCKENREEA